MLAFWRHVRNPQVCWGHEDSAAAGSSSLTVQQHRTDREYEHVSGLRACFQNATWAIYKDDTSEWPQAKRCVVTIIYIYIYIYMEREREYKYIYPYMIFISLYDLRYFIPLMSHSGSMLAFWRHVRNPQACWGHEDSAAAGSSSLTVQQHRTACEYEHVSGSRTGF